MKFDRLRPMTYDITKHSRKNKFLQNNDFLFVWNANLINYKENFFFVIFSVENRAYFFSRKPCLHSSKKLNIKHLNI